MWSTGRVGHRDADTRRRMAGRLSAAGPVPADAARGVAGTRRGVLADVLDDETWRIALQTWVIEVDGLTVLVDTGAGNDRDRAAMPPLDHLDTDFLDALQRAGVRPNRSTSSSTRTFTLTTSGGTPSGTTIPGCRPSRMRATSSRRPTTATSIPRTPTRPPARTEDEQARQDQAGSCGRTASHRSTTRADPAVVRRPSDQRLASAATCAGPQPGLVGAVAGRGQARRLRRRPHPQPDATAPAG